MELRHLRYFVAVSESLHFGDAAARLRIAQPSLSQQIRQLEEELQTSLLRRTKRRVELTEAGALFLEEARDILARADRAAVIARRVGRGEGGKLRIGVGYCMDQMAVVRAVSLFNRRHPRIRVELQTMAVPLQVSALQHGRLDVGFVRFPVTDSFVTNERVVSEPLVIALPRAHRLAGTRAVPLSALADEPFVLTARDLVPVYHDIVLRMCRDAGFVPHVVHETDQLHMLLGFVGAGCGLALVPAFARRIKPRGVVFVSLRPSSPNLETVVAWRREKTSATLTDFITTARRALVRAQQKITSERSRGTG
jgi:DNA-binding transcriptional LysR family regulator